MLLSWAKCSVCIFNRKNEFPYFVTVKIRGRDDALKLKTEDVITCCVVRAVVHLWGK
jgi:hypothetical protein